MLTTPVPNVPIAAEDKPLFAAINTFVKTYMSQPGHDNSHDYQHILRVVSNANKILAAEIEAKPSHNYNTTALFLAALLHDVGDHKYATPGEDVENQIAVILRERGASEELALRVQTLAKHVGYTNEVKDPDSVVQALAKYPELAIVQDADRLDSIGAVGVGRCFSYGAAKCPDEPMSRAIDHFAVKLFKLPAMMKTAAGREMAVERHKVLEEFAKNWEEETTLSFGFE